MRLIQATVCYPGNAVRIVQATIHVLHATFRLAQGTVHVVQAAVRLGQAAVRLGQAAVRLGQAAVRLGQAAVRLVQATNRCPRNAVRVLQAAEFFPRNLVHLVQSPNHLTQGSRRAGETCDRVVHHHARRRNSFRLPADPRPREVVLKSQSRPAGFLNDEDSVCLRSVRPGKKKPRKLISEAFQIGCGGSI